MPKWAVVLLGCVMCPLLAVVVFFVAVKLRAEILVACEIETTPGEGLGLVVAAPIIIVGTLIATAVLYSLTVTLVQRKWSVYAAAALAIVAAVVIVPVAVNHMYEPVATSRCADGTPSWWPF